jgi:hypothetical protein
MALSVTVAHRKTYVVIESDDAAYPDLLDDMCRRATTTLATTLACLLATLED